MASAAAAVLVAAVVAALLIARAAGLRQTESYSVPARWHDVSPPEPPLPPLPRPHLIWTPAPTS